MSASPTLVTVGGGKGGVGKTLVTANLAAALAAEGRRVVAVDADLAGANLHSCLGVPPPPASLADFLTGRQHDFEKLVWESGTPNLRLVAGIGGHPGFSRLRPARGAELARALHTLDCDFVLIDLSAGLHPEVVDLFLLGNPGLLVMVPEPTSVENAYGFLRAALYRRLWLGLRDSGVRDRVRDALDERNERGIRTPLDLLREVQALDADEGERFQEIQRAYRPRLVVNQVRSVQDIKLGFSVRSVCRKYFGVEVDYLGYLNHDEAARRSVLERRPLVDAFPESDSAVYLRRIARKLARCAEPAPA